MNKKYPKSSSVALLRRISDGVLFLVAAVHLESGPRTELVRTLVIVMATAIMMVIGNGNGSMTMVMKVLR